MIELLIRIILKSLLLTIVFEELMLLVQKERNIKIYISCLVINILTNVSMNISLIVFVKYYVILLIIFEIVVLFIEALVYNWFKRDFLDSLKISFLCNFGSFIIGLLF